MTSRFDVITLFPDYFSTPLKQSLLGKAIDEGRLIVGVHDLRNWGTGPHRSVDDTPFGGGPGMVMSPGPLVEAAESVLIDGGRCIVLAAAGELLTQSLALELSDAPQLVVLCGRYEGIDARVAPALGATELSIGEFVISGGEAAALVLIEAVARLEEGVLGNASSLQQESFTDGMLEYPQYTRPPSFRNLEVPEVLLSGDHGKVESWRREQSLRRTVQLRPELLLDPEVPENSPE